MGKKMGDGVDISSTVYLKRCESMAEAMEGYVLGDACGLEPILKRALRIMALQVLENKTGRRLST
jgi:hypothetical protein